MFPKEHWWVPYHLSLLSPLKLLYNIQIVYQVYQTALFPPFNLHYIHYPLPFISVTFWQQRCYDCRFLADGLCLNPAGRFWCLEDSAALLLLTHSTCNTITHTTPCECHHVSGGVCYKNTVYNTYGCLYFSSLSISREINLWQSIQLNTCILVFVYLTC